MTNNKLIAFIGFILAIALVSTTWADCDLFVDSPIMTKRYCGEVALLIFVILIALKGLAGKNNSQSHPGNMDMPFFLVSALILLNAFSQAVYGIIYCYAVRNECIGVSGSFDNPAGFVACLCMSLPFASTFRNRGKLLRSLTAILSCVIILAIVLSKSRAGIISLGGMLCAAAYCKGTFHKRWFRYLAVGVMLLMLAGGYFLKKDSADGRMLIWRCSLGMVADKPLFGFGPGGFRAHYMDYQATWLLEHPDSRLAMLADNVQSPFNEFIGIAVEYGCIGLMAAIVAIAWLLSCCWRNRYLDCIQAVSLSLLAVMMLSLFSYPFSYAIVWIILFIDVCVVTFKSVSFSKVTIKKACAVTLFLACILCMKCTVDICNELEWRRSIPVIRKSDLHWIDKYEMLMERMQANPFFLYNYSAELYDAGLYEDCINKAMLCRRYWADYDLEMLIGQAFLQKNDYSLAEPYFRQASDMCPNRFFPLYYLMKLYDCSNETGKALATARQIESKPMKVPSLEVLQIRKEASDYILSHH